MTTTTPTTSTTDVAPLQTVGTQTLVSVVAGGHELVMKTDHLVGVYQLSQEQLESANRGKIETRGGDVPVVDLSKVVDDCLGLKPQTESVERALITIEYDGKVAMLRAKQVSRPMYIPDGQFHELPHIAHPNDTDNLVKYLANIDPDATDPNTALRMLFDPLVALGLGTSEEISMAESTRIAKSFIKNMGGGFEGLGKSKRNQLLAFVPEDFARDSLDFVFCLPLSSVAEVVKSQQIFEMPINSPLFAGYFLWRKIPVPIVKLGAAFGASPEDVSPSAGRRIVVSRVGSDRYVGFYSQAQMQSMKVPTSIPHKIDDSLPSLGAFKTEFSTLVIPDLGQILDGVK